MTRLNPSTLELRENQDHPYVVYKRLILDKDTNRLRVKGKKKMQIVTKRVLCGYNSRQNRFEMTKKKLVPIDEGQSVLIKA